MVITSSLVSASAVCVQQGRIPDSEPVLHRLLQTEAERLGAVHVSLT